MDRHPQTNAGASAKDAEASSASTRGQILIVDDEEALVRAHARLLRDAGFQVETAPNGKLAIEELRRRQFDMVLSDISMPEMGGIELLRAIREHDLDISVVIMTGGPDLGTALGALEHGALRYLVKPIEHPKLLAVAESAIQLSRMARVKRQALLLVGDAEKFVGDRLGLDLHFTRALEGIWMVFQPIVLWSKREIYAYELLLRCGEQLFASPCALLSAAERSGRLVELGRAIRRAVAGEAAEMGERLLFMNLHTRDLNDEELFSADAPLSKFARNVVLEITERRSLEEVADIQPRLERLRQMGYRIALDDLGAGYAGLTSLAQLNPEVVKLDMSLIRDLDKDPARQQLVGAMVKLSKDMGKQVVIEGVETVGERETLVQLGGDLLQGFLFARPGRPIPAVTW